jgi:hypothetical protein
MVVARKMVCESAIQKKYNGGQAFPKILTVFAVSKSLSTLHRRIIKMVAPKRVHGEGDGGRRFLLNEKASKHVNSFP